MTLSIAIVFLIVLGMIILFAFEVFPVDKVSFVVLAVLMLSGLVTPEEAVSGFSNPATITILCLMIIAIGLEDNGVINALANGISKLKFLPAFLMAPIFMILAGGISAFISTTAVVIIFIKLVSTLAAKGEVSRARLLMPISFAGIVGGSCTLMGTSTNLLVNSIAQSKGVERMTFFEFSEYGLIFFAITLVLMTLLSHLLPKEKKKDKLLSEDYDLSDYLVLVHLEKESNLVGQTVAGFLEKLPKSLMILNISRIGLADLQPDEEEIIMADDRLLIQGGLADIVELDSLKGMRLMGREDKALDQAQEELNLIEVLVLPNSKLIGHTLEEIRPYDLRGAVPIAISKDHNLRTVGERLTRIVRKRVEVEAGDKLLVEVNDKQEERLNSMRDLIIMDYKELPAVTNKSKRIISILILLFTIGLAATGTISILKSTITGCMLMLLTKCITLQDVYGRVNWQIIFLLAGLMPLGIAMQNCGADDWIAKNLLSLLTGKSPVIVIGILFGITMLMSGFVSNNATAIIITPIAIAISAGLALPPKPFILAVMFAANFSFFTPVGYQTNALIYGTGLYRFSDFTKIGGVISIALWITATLLLSFWGGLF